MGFLAALIKMPNSSKVYPSRGLDLKSGLLPGLAVEMQVSNTSKQDFSMVIMEKVEFINTKEEVGWSEVDCEPPKGQVGPAALDVVVLGAGF